MKYYHTMGRYDLMEAEEKRLQEYEQAHENAMRDCLIRWGIGFFRCMN